MKKDKIGSIAVILGGLLLSIELYGLKFFLLVESHDRPVILSYINQVRRLPITNWVNTVANIFCFSCLQIYGYGGSDEKLN